MRWNLGIDLGTQNVRMVEAGAASLLDAPALLAFREDVDEPVAAGSEAQVLLGRTGPETRLTSPLPEND